MYDHDPILDAMLSETLGGVAPPDLSARILQSWAARGLGQIEPHLLDALQGVPVPPPVAEAWLEPAAPPLQTVPANGQELEPLVARTVQYKAPRKLRHSRKRQPSWLPAALAASLALAGLGIGYLVFKSSDERPVAVKPGHRNTAPEVVHTKPRETNNNTKQPHHPPLIGTNNTNTNPKRTDNEPDTRPPMFRTGEDPKVAVALPKSAWQDLEALSDQEIVSFVNEEVAAAWKANRVQPSASATDAEWCRRVYLRLIGRVPTIDELADFTGDKNKDKRPALVDRLLFDEKYSDEFARYWATQWSNTLIGRSAAMEKNSLVSAEGLQKYLRDAIHANKPYDEIAFELISATGSGQPGADDFNGAVNFLVASQNEDASLATARTSRVFLGQQLHCAQCHDHPFNETSQRQFWAMNSFFRQMQVEKIGNSARLVNRDFRGQSGDIIDADVFYEQRNGQMKVAYPEFVDGTKIPRSGQVKEVDRRDALAKMVAASDDLSRAMVNRMWAHFLGYGLTRPVDDMGQHNPPTHPAVLEKLAQQFKAHNYNTKDLLRWLALSQPFGLSSKIESKNIADAPQLGTAPLFSHYYTRQMQAEELYESLIAVAQIAKRGGTPAERDQARLAWLGQFSQSYKTDEGDEEHTFNGTIPQSLMMMNGELMQQAISAEHSALLKRVAESKMEPLEKVEHLFMAAVARKPDRRELEVAKQLIAAHDGRVNDALSDVWWALLNSNEFILDH